MPAAPRRRRNSSSESSDGSSSDDDDYISSTTIPRSTTNKPTELTLKDDEDTIDFQAPLPDDYGKMIDF
jgi:hypothetical protein